MYSFEVGRASFRCTPFLPPPLPPRLGAACFLGIAQRSEKVTHAHAFTSVPRAPLPAHQVLQIDLPSPTPPHAFRLLDLSLQVVPQRDDSYLEQR